MENSQHLIRHFISRQISNLHSTLDVSTSQTPTMVSPMQNEGNMGKKVLNGETSRRNTAKIKDLRQVIPMNICQRRNINLWDNKQNVGIDRTYSTEKTQNLSRSKSKKKLEVSLKKDSRSIAKLSKLEESSQKNESTANRNSTIMSIQDKSGMKKRKISLVKFTEIRKIKDFNYQDFLKEEQECQKQIKAYLKTNQKSHKQHNQQKKYQQRKQTRHVIEDKQLQQRNRITKANADIGNGIKSDFRRVQKQMQMPHREKSSKTKIRLYFSKKKQ